MKANSNFGMAQGRSRCLYTLIAVLLFCATPVIHAAEGGVDVYVPGFYGDFQMAVLPEKGLTYLNYLMYSKTDSDIASRQGLIHLDLESEVIANTFGLLYASDKKIFGGRFFASIYVPLMHAELDARVETGNDFQPMSAGNAGLADVYAVPIGINWQWDSVSINFFQGINVPVGKYDVNDPLNLGLNRWALDTNVAITWLDQNGPFEVNLNLGYLINGTNSDTDYRSGNAFHIDYSVGYHASESLSVALIGYGYRQVTGDSGTGAILGSFKGRSYGLGAAVSYVFDTKIPFVLTGKWLHDLSSTNRMMGDYAYLVVVVPIG